MIATGPPAATDVALHCPACGGALEALRCGACAREFPTAAGIPDLRLRGDAPAAPIPHLARELDALLARAERTGEWRGAWEDFLASLPPRDALRMEWAIPESVSAATLLASFDRAAPALVAGSGFLGTPVALAMRGAPVVLVDASLARARFARARAAGNGLRVAPILAGDGPRLPFADATFGLVVLTDVPRGLPASDGESAAEVTARWLREAARVLRADGQLVALAANRFAYKRSTGLHGEYDRPGPLAFAARALAGRGGERTLAGYRRALGRAGLRLARAAAPYPSHLDYSRVAGLRPGEPPDLEVGPKERRNVAKVIAHRLGLFAWLTPSFALVAAREGAAPREAILERIAREACDAELGGSAGLRIDRMLATRGNGAIVLVSIDAAACAARGERPGLVLRIPLSVAKGVKLARRHLLVLPRARALNTGLPIPRAFAEREVEGVRTFVEERRPGIGAPQQSGDARRRARTLDDLARGLSKLAREPELLDDAALDDVVFSRVRTVAARVLDRAVAAAFEALGARVASGLRGKRLPLPPCHADLRAKQVLVDDDGAVTAILDFGTWRDRSLPLFDLVHFVVHDHKRPSDPSLAAATRRALHPRALAEHEEKAVRAYCAALAIDEETRALLERFYPVEVAYTALANWDFDRPHWVERNFGEVVALPWLAPATPLYSGPRIPGT